MLGSEYLNHLWKGGSGKLKALARPLLKDGIGKNNFKKIFFVKFILIL